MIILKVETYPKAGNKEIIKKCLLSLSPYERDVIGHHMFLYLNTFSLNVAVAIHYELTNTGNKANVCLL